MRELVFPVDLDHRYSFEDLVRMGCYDWVDSTITEVLFPFPKKKRRGTASLVLVDYPYTKQDVTTNSLVYYAQSKKFELAQTEHLLLFGLTYPKMQRLMHVVALGSKPRLKASHTNVVVLTGSHQGRSLTTRHFNAEWPTRIYKFLCVKP